MTHYNFYLYSSLINALSAAFLGLYVYIKNKKKLINRSFALMSTSMAIWSMGIFFCHLTKDRNFSVYLNRFMVHGAAVFIPVTYLRFILIYLEQYKEKRKIFLSALAIGLFLLSFIFSPYLIKEMRMDSFYRFWPVPGPVYPLFLIYFVGILIYALHLLLKDYPKQTGYKRNQMKYVVFASLIGSIGGCSNYFLFYDIPIQPFAHPLVSLYPLMFWYAIVRYRLMDINIAITRAGIFIIVYTLVLGIPFGLGYITKSWLASTGFAVFLATLGPFIFTYLHRKAERGLRREEFLAHEALNNLTQDMMRYTKLEPLLKFIVSHVAEIMKVSSAAIYLKDEASRHYRLKANWSINNKLPEKEVFSEDSLLVKTILSRKVPIVTEELRFAASDKLKMLQAELNEAEAAVLIPAFKADALFGFLTLGTRKDNRMFTQEDLNIFTTLTNQAVLAIDNARAYEELIHTRDQLVKVEKLATMGEFATEVAHEIKNPLQAIKAFTELINEKYNDKDFREKFSKLVTAEVDRIDNFVRQLIKVAHPLPPNLTTVDVNEILNSVLELMENNLTNNNISVKKQFDINPLRIEADKDQLKQIFLNIITNAIDAMKNSKKKFLTISTFSIQPHAIIKIADTGCGIPPDSIPRLFNTLFTTKEKGSGLGLSIVDTIIKNHKGKIEVDGKVGEGTTFTIII